VRAALAAEAKAPPPGAGANDQPPMERQSGAAPAASAAPWGAAWIPDEIAIEAIL
jgi:hypothetical protein